MTTSATPVKDFALEEQHKQKFILSQNLAALIAARNDTLEQYGQAATSIPAALVELKWVNRREIYPLLVKEEVYGAVLNEIMRRYPQFKAKIMARIEANFQVIKTQEMATLTLLRQLADGEFKTTTVVALPSDASPAVKTAPTASPAKR